MTSFCAFILEMKYDHTLHVLKRLQSHRRMVCLLSGLVLAATTVTLVAAAPTPEYEIIEIRDLSRKPFMKAPSEYTAAEISALPINRKLEYRIVIGDAVTGQDVEPLMRRIVSDIVSKDKDIDELILTFYSEKNITDMPYDIGSVVWAPYGKLGNVTPEIARTNNRTDYALKWIFLHPDLGSYLEQRRKSKVRHGLTEVERRKIFKELVKAQDKANFEAERKYPTMVILAANGIDYCVSPETVKQNFRKNDTYAKEIKKRYEQEMLNKYDLSGEQIEDLMNEGLNENWPFPSYSGSPKCSDLL